MCVARFERCYVRCKILFCLCLYSNGRLLVMAESGPGLGCMSLPRRMILELFHV